MEKGGIHALKYSRATTKRQSQGGPRAKCCFLGLGGRTNTHACSTEYSIQHRERVCTAPFMQLWLALPTVYPYSSTNSLSLCHFMSKDMI